MRLSYRTAVRKAQYGHGSPRLAYTAARYTQTTKFVLLKKSSKARSKHSLGQFLCSATGAILPLRAPTELKPALIFLFKGLEARGRRARWSHGAGPEPPAPQGGGRARSAPGGRCSPAARPPPRGSPRGSSPCSATARADKGGRAGKRDLHPTPPKNKPTNHEEK